MKSFIGKMLLVGIVAVLLLIASGLLNSVVSDRLRNRDQARQSITQSLAGEQTVAGVSLVIPYTEHYEEAITDKTTKEVRLVARKLEHRFEVLPDRTDFAGQLITDPRHRGLFRVNGYILNGKLAGDFAIPPATALPRDRADSRLVFEPARLVLAISDPRGLRKLGMTLDGAARAIESGTGGQRAGAHARVDDIAALLGRPAKLNVMLELVGTDSLNIVPLGRENTARIDSPWRHPSFGGRFLPVEREIRETGFNATWRVSSLATNAREAWSTRNGEVDSFSVSLIDPVDIYVMADRASKYAALFIALTLGGFLLFELLRSLRLHAMHYLLIGAALLVFFLLLLGLSERLGFASAYALASTACVLLISVYAVPLLRSAWLAGGFALGLGSLYGALYVILLSEQNALLMGSLLLFGLLAAVMLGTRKVDWHRLLAERPAVLADEAKA